MTYKVYTQQEVLERTGLTEFLLDTIIDNLSWLFGEDMDSRENRQEWIAYNLQTPQFHWRAVVAERQSVPVGFLVYSIENSVLTVNDVEITRSVRFAPGILRGLFAKMCEEDFNCITGYINRENQVSLDNFQRYATKLIPRADGYRIEIDPEKTAKIKEKFEKST